MQARHRARCQRDLPFVRAHLWEAVLEGRLELRMAPPPVCDLCALRPLADLRRLFRTYRGYPADVGFELEELRAL
jgi:hypothetical protein